MGKLSGMCVGLGMLAAIAAMPAYADAPADADGADAGSSVPVTRVKRVGTRLETIVVAAGAVDRDGKRWEDSGAKTATLPTVSDDAFLDGEESGRP